MKPAWDQLMEAYADSGTVLIADADCTASGKSLCQAHNVRGYPTIKYGDPGGELEQYKGGRDYVALKKFAEENLKPICSPANIDSCSDIQKAEITKLSDMGPKALEALIAENDKDLKAAEAKHNAEISALTSTFAEFKKRKTSELSLQKSVMSAVKKGDKEEL